MRTRLQVVLLALSLPLTPVSMLALTTGISMAQGTPAKAVADKAAADKSAPDKPSSDTSSDTSSNSNDPSASKAGAQSSGSSESSSHDTRVDITPPKDDDKNHPASREAVADLDVTNDLDATGVQEFHPWSPMKAMKDIEVGDFYFKRKNYKAALDRYKEALYYKDGDALASFRLATCQEKLGDKAEAKKYFEQYLKVQPEGPLAKEAHASLDKLAKSQ